MVDLWGGYKDREGALWSQDTMAPKLFHYQGCGSNAAPYLCRPWAYRLRCSRRNLLAGIRPGREGQRLRCDRSCRINPVFIIFAKWSIMWIVCWTGSI